MKRSPLLLETYVHFNATASKALTTLKGLVDGVTCDHQLNDLERWKILDWCDQFSFLKKHPAFSSVFDYLAEVLVDGILTLEACKGISRMVNRNLRSFYDQTTQSIQELHGLISGIAADNVLASVELDHLWNWLNNNENLKGFFPYDEVYSLVCRIRRKGALSSAEKDLLLRSFSWTENSSISIENALVPWEIDPEIRFEDRSFCLTGISRKMRRPQIEAVIKERNGKVVSSVSIRTNYLIIFGEANVAWTYACYGRKVEKALKLRREGARLAIISEQDFWDSTL